jgi:hypothetical protein
MAIVDAQRRELPRRLRDTPARGDRRARALGRRLLMAGIVLWLRADLRWLGACERTWTARRDTS